MGQTELFDEQIQTVNWGAPRDIGLSQLKAFLPKAGRAYASMRNHDLGPENRSNISCLSPWIRHRLILEEEVLQQTLARHSLTAAEKFIQEVFWRSYFKGWLEQKPGVWTNYCQERDRHIENLERFGDLRADYNAAIRGQTGIDCFDAWANELVDTGYLHNHARMWFASIWIFTLRLPWQLGADFFFRHLMDGDPASNTCSWRWVAGLHTKGKHYIARASNIERYTGGRFAPKGLANDPLPLSEDIDFAVEPLPLDRGDTLDENYGLLILEEDCNVETLELRRPPAGTIALCSTHSRSPLDLGICAMRFASEAIADGQRRANAKFECEGCLIQPDDLVNQLVDASEQLGVKTLVSPWLPVGPLRDKFDSARSGLSDAGIGLVPILRPYDLACWPHASKGFFKLKSKIASIIDDLGISDLR